MDMVPLSGTPKQVVWATDIRRKAMGWIEASYPLVKQERRDEAINAVESWLASHTDARYWIDNREALARLALDLMPVRLMANLMKGEDGISAIHWT